MATLTRDEIVRKAASLPAFPRVVTEILATLDDDNASIGALAHHVERDPVITARIMSRANSAALHAYPGATIRDVATATSMIGIASVREIVLATSLADFARNSRVSSSFWEHSVAVGVCSQEIARQTRVSLDYALVAGLLHDIGQLWMAKFHPLEFQMVRTALASGGEGVNNLESERLGLDHCEIGRVLAEYWELPTAVTAAIFHHHQPDAALDEPLVAVTHVAEVLSNALDLARREENEVLGLSPAACAVIGIDWSADLRSLFGTIEARSQYACAVFR